MDIPAGLLLAAVPPGADLVQLFVIPLMALLAADVCEAALLIDPTESRLIPRLKGGYLPGCGPASEAS
jgi:hypothetical protein